MEYGRLFFLPRDISFVTRAEVKKIIANQVGKRHISSLLFHDFEVPA